MKYILVTGGVISGIGKGIVTSSLGALLRACNLRVTAIKIDPYLNIDAGTFSPYEHGEVFVLNDGAEVDLDLGNYERYLDTDLCASNNITLGRIYQKLLRRERQGNFMGKTVQIVPHVTDEIQQWVEETAASQEADVCLIELGGTVGDIESMPFLEALRQMKRRVKRDNFCCCLVNLVPCIGVSKEQKTKPCQASVATLRHSGFFPDMIVCRCDMPLLDHVKDKISNFCEVDSNHVFDLPNLNTVYRVPIQLYNQGILQALSEILHLDLGVCELSKWHQIIASALDSTKEVNVALVGKYTRLEDCYTSVAKAVEHACYPLGFKPCIRYIESEQLEVADDQAWTALKSADCLIVPGGFGARGIEGKIRAIKWARENNLPFLGICLGFQLAAIEWARNVIGISNAHSEEFVEELGGQGEFTVVPIVIEMLDYVDEERKLGGTMRLGLKKTYFCTDNSIVREYYGNVDAIEERHRHRYEINPLYIEKLQTSGLRFVGKDETSTRMEILELDKNRHNYFLGVQYHPEYLSRLFKPSPPFTGLIKAAILTSANSTAK